MDRREMSQPLMDEVEVVPFFLTRPESPSRNVVVVDPLQAHYITDNLKTTHTQFKPNNDGVLKMITKAALGFHSRAVFEKEEMITLGAQLFAVGRVSRTNGTVTLEPPTSGKDYIITTQSKRELLATIYHSSRIYRILALTFGSVGLVFLLYKAYVRIRKWLVERESRTMFDDIRQRLRDQAAARIGRRRRRSSQTSTSDAAAPAPAAETATSNAKGDRINIEDNGDSTCVVCLLEDRNVVLLNCGHICVCVNCAELLPLPKKCPVCRATVERIIPVYHP